MFVRLLWRSRKNADYRRRWSERLGFFPHRIQNSIWIHAASVGETIAAIPLINALKAQYPDLPVLITNMTITGAARTKAVFGDSVFQAYVPYDVPSALHRFLKRTRPIVALIFETELWPNLFNACDKEKIPVIVVNARLSAKSAKGYERIKSIIQEMLTITHTLAVQTPAEAERFISLGLPADRAVVTGNIKFDIQVPDELIQEGAELHAKLNSERLMWIAASTHASEEEIILAAHKKIVERFPHALLILVPRHPERFDSVYELVKQQNFNVSRRSLNEECGENTQVYLGDTMGELLLLYSVCDVAFIAGSFVPVGGHNMLEAAVLGKPIVTGPQLFNFLEISRLLIEAKGMVKVETGDALAAEIIHLFENADYRKQTGENAKKFVDLNRGSLRKQLNIILTVVDERLNFHN